MNHIYDINQITEIQNFIMDIFNVEQLNFLHENVDTLGMHIDIVTIPPDPPKRDNWILVTIGMSAYKMNTDNPDDQYMELLIELPAEWPVDKESIKSPNNWWPIEHMYRIARHPRRYNTWLGYGHTFSTEECVKIENSDFVGFILSDVCEIPSGVMEYETIDGRKINFYQMIPIFEDELSFKLANDESELFYKMSEAEIFGVVDINRKSCLAE